MTHGNKPVSEGGGLHIMWHDWYELGLIPSWAGIWYSRYFEIPVPGTPLCIYGTGMF